MKAEIIYGHYKTRAAREKGVLSIDCPVTAEDARELKSKFGVSVPNVATQERCTRCIFCREVFDNFCKCVFESWKSQTESVKESYVTSYRKSLYHIYNSNENDEKNNTV